jgi:hypothetical protein
VAAAQWCHEAWVNENGGIEMMSNLSLIVLVIGLALYFLAEPAHVAKLTEVGRIMFWVGLLAYLLKSTHA